jgi:hypothetical protein
VAPSLVAARVGTLPSPDLPAAEGAVTPRALPALWKYLADAGGDAGVPSQRVLHCVLPHVVRGGSEPSFRRALGLPGLPAPPAPGASDPPPPPPGPPGELLLPLRRREA